MDNMHPKMCMLHNYNITINKKVRCNQIGKPLPPMVYFKNRMM